MSIPVGGKKPTKGARDNTYIFYCVEGAVRVVVHRTSFIITSNGMFMVPRGNHYYIENICDRECKLFFAQARKVPERLLQSPRKGGSLRPPSVPATSRTTPKATPKSKAKQVAADPRTTSSVQKPKKKNKTSTSNRGLLIGPL
ncbi:hypothetical protein FRC02_004791 [Tulasnella sp. 418]|nr:hypothetical protein FRC02_004791 [Tulasnella sp. 418]